MKRWNYLIFSLALLCPATHVSAQTVVQTFYVDFGYNNSSAKGMKTVKDDNGNYWTNVTCTDDKYVYPGTSFALINSKNDSTSYSIFVNTRFSANGKKSGGGLLSPSADLLGDLAVGSATEDYLFTEAHQNYSYFTFKGLDVNKGYRFYTFGSRSSSDARKVIYRFHGETIWTGTQQTGGTGIGANGYNGNNNKITTSDIIFPNKDGEITFTLIKLSGSYVPVNAMKIEEVEGAERPHANLSLSSKYYIDFGENNNDSRGHQTTGADVNGNYWNNVYCQSGNVIASGSKYDLIDAKNAASSIVMEMGGSLKTNGMSGGGGLTKPTVANLKDLAVATATEDYAFLDNTNSTNIKLSGLDKNHCYKFFFFGSRNAGNGNTRREVILTLDGQNQWTSWMITSGSSIGGKDVQGNVRNVEQSDYIYPDDNGNITLTMAKNTANTSTNYAHLNLMKIEEYAGGQRPEGPLHLSDLKIEGSAVEGNAVPMTPLNPTGVYTGMYEAYLKLGNGTYHFAGVDAKGDTVILGQSDNAQTLVKQGNDFTSSAEQVVRVFINMKTMSCSILPVKLYCKGNVVPNDTIRIDYQGYGVWSSTVTLNKNVERLYVDKTFYFGFNNADSLNLQRITNTTDSLGMPALGYAAAPIHLNDGTYTVTVDMRNYHYTLSAPIDENRISVFGSSVSNGQGATNNHGYAYLYNLQLSQRYADGESATPFAISSIAINGNNTVSLLNRYCDLTCDFGKYVIFGLSLGNEGIHNGSNQEKIFNQFKENMLKLIDKAKADGKTPVVMNNYAREDFNSSDYHYVKKMNLLIHQWNLPSINLLGAIDNGKGVWATGYSAGDTYHPNTKGHQEFLYAMVPSLFDAIKNGKTTPARDTTQSTTLGHKSTISFKGEGTVHPFAVSLRVKGGNEGQLLSIASEDGNVSLSFDANGKLNYQSGQNTMASTGSLNDGKWHYITLSSYYAQQRTLLYVDSTLVGETNEHFVPTDFTIGDTLSDVSREVSEVAFWRSALNEEEVRAWNDGTMLNSSLEIYSPIHTGTLDNLAISENRISLNPGKDATSIDGTVVAGSLRVKPMHGGMVLQTNGQQRVKIAHVSGMLTFDGNVCGTMQINSLPCGIYVVNHRKVVVP